MSTRKSAFITGVATGIGKDVALALAQEGWALTLLDLDVAGLQQTAQEARALQQQQQQSQQGGPSQSSVATVACDVCGASATAAAFKAHAAQFGAPPDLVLLNAGIGERGDLFDAANSGWQATLDVDLTAVVIGVRESVLAMGSRGGTIITIASAGGMFPMPVSPVYAAAKAGVVHLVRSAGPGLARQRGVRLAAVCPEFVDTPLVRRVMAEDPNKARRLLGSLDIKLLPPSAVTALILTLLRQQDLKGGTVAVLRQDGSVQYPFAHAPKSKGAAAAAAAVGGTGQQQQQQPELAWPGQEVQQRRAAWATANLPASYRKIQVHTLSSDFNAATRIVTAPLPAASALPPGTLLLRRVFVGINASDINYTAGRYFGSRKEAAARLPFDAGFESASVVVAAGPGVTGFAPGDAVATLSYDGFAEFALAPAAQALRVPCPSAEVVAMLTSGLTASIALADVAQLRAGEKVLVTAAAGGTGQFAVQLAKLAGCHVIATAGGPAKAAMLRGLGADRVIDYKSESLKEVLTREYPKGVDVVYESVGGDMFDAAVNGLAHKGRLLVIGMMSQYQEGWPASAHPGLPEKLLWKSAALQGFFLLRHAQAFRPHLARLMALHAAGKLQVAIDPQRFVGIDSVPAAVSHLHSGASSGKVVVQLAPSLPPMDPCPSSGSGAASKL